MNKQKSYACRVSPYLYSSLISSVNISFRPADSGEWFFNAMSPLINVRKARNIRFNGLLKLISESRVAGVIYKFTTSGNFGDDEMEARTLCRIYSRLSISPSPFARLRELHESRIYRPFDIFKCHRASFHNLPPSSPFLIK